MNDYIQNCFYRTSVKALVLDSDNKFLLVQEGNGVWELPGGGLDFNEDIVGCLKREIQEEMGLEVAHIESSPDYFFTFKGKEGWKANVIYKTKLKNLDFKPSRECVALRFFNKKEALELDVLPNVTKFLDLLE